jgi:hypothetical protein
MGSAMQFLHGVIGRAALIDIQILNAILFFAFAWIAENWRSGIFVRHRQAS